MTYRLKSTGRSRRQDMAYEETEFGDVPVDPRYGPGTLEKVREELEYDPLTGHFTRRKAGRGVSQGDRAGGKSGRYRTIAVNGVTFEEHVLAWLFSREELPKGRVMHRNGDTTDNRADNLFDNTYLDDQDRGVFFRPDLEQFEVRLYTRGGNGRKSMGLFPSYAQALQAATAGAHMIGEGKDARTVRKVLSTGAVSDKVGLSRGDVRTKAKDLPAIYDGIHCFYDLSKPLPEVVYGEDDWYEGGQKLLWFVSRLRNDRYLDGGYPYYGPFGCKEDAEDKVAEYYELRNKGVSKATALELLGMPQANLRVDRKARRTYFWLAKYMPDGFAAPKLEIKEVALEGGELAYILTSLPGQPEESQEHFIRMDVGRMSQMETWRAFYDYAVARKEGVKHLAALKASCLGHFDFIAGKGYIPGEDSSAEDLVAGEAKRVLDRRPAAREPEILPVGGQYKIAGIRGMQELGNLGQYVTYGTFPTLVDAQRALRAYLMYKEYDPDLDIGGHEYALRMSGLATKLIS